MKAEKRNCLTIAFCSLFMISCWTAPTSTDRPPSTPDRPSDRNNVNQRSTNSSSKEANNSSDRNTSRSGDSDFAKNLPAGIRPANSVEEKLMKEYGAVFVSRGTTAPAKIIFADEAEVAKFQGGLSVSRKEIGGFSMELQSAAMNALNTAIGDARAKALSITPRGADSAKRTYDETVGLWESRVDPALVHWVGKGRLTKADADHFKAMSTFDQVKEVLRLEEDGIWFAKDLSKSILFSVAPPGTSQHLSMLAFDVKEHENAEVRRILNENGWFQTVVTDLPHFTYLGVKESELTGLGLKKRTDSVRTYWVPDI